MRKSAYTNYMNNKGTIQLAQFTPIMIVNNNFPDKNFKSK